MNEQQIMQIIGQFESSIDKIEDSLSEEDFKDYCDATYTSITYWRLLLKSVKEAKNGS